MRLNLVPFQGALGVNKGLQRRHMGITVELPEWRIILKRDWG